MKIKKLSIVLPVYNEEENIQPLYELLSVVLNKCGRDFEILFVDDGSNDNSFEVLKDIQSSDNKVRLIKLRSNFGQSAAMDAGIRNSKGDIIVMMDADMQNDPRDIPKLLEKMESGYDMVSGWRYNRKDSFFKRF